MLDFLNQIIDIASTLIGLIVNVVDALLNFVILLPKYITFLTLSVGYLPSVFLSFILFGFFVCILLLFLGRN